MPTDSEILLSVNIVSYNTKVLTEQTLHSLIQDITHSKLLHKKSEIFVVDNNSSDGSVAMLQALAKESPVPLTLLRNTNNTGFAAANNQAILKNSGKYIFLLNSDTIVQAGALEQLVTTFEKHPEKSTAETVSHHGEIDRLGILAPTLHNPDGSVQAQGGSLPTLLTLFCQMSLLDDIPLLGKLLPSTQHTGKRAKQTHTQLTPMGWLSGAALMIKRETIAEIGLLDQEIFMYGEDMEWCMRAHDHLWDVALDTQAHITHLQSQSSGSKNAILGELRGYVFIWAKHKPLWQLPLVRQVIKMGLYLRIMLFTLLGRYQKVHLYSQVRRQFSQ